MFISKCMCLLVSVYTRCLQCLQRPKEGVRSPEIGVTGDKEPSWGARNQSLILLRGHSAFTHWVISPDPYNFYFWGRVSLCSSIRPSTRRAGMYRHALFRRCHLWEWNQSLMSAQTLCPGLSLSLSFTSHPTLEKPLLHQPKIQTVKNISISVSSNMSSNLIRRVLFKVRESFSCGFQTKHTQILNRGLGGRNVARSSVPSSATD